MPHRSYPQAPLAPALHRAVHLLAHRYGLLIALCDHLRLTLWPLSNDRAESVFTLADHLKDRVELARVQLDLRQRAQVKITRGSDPRPRLPRRHLAVTHLEQPVPAHARLHPRNTGYIEGVIGSRTRHHIRGQRHSQGIQNGLHHFDLRQVRAIILAVAKLEEASFRHHSIGTGAGAIDMHPFGGEVIHPHRVLIQGRLKSSPPRVITQVPQHDFESVIGEIDASDRLSGRDPQGPKPLRHPGFNMHHAVVTPGQHGAEPDRAHPAQTETCPVAVGGKMVIEQRRQTHPLHLFDQQRNVVDALRDDVGYLIHAQSLAQSGIYLQIWANRECSTFKFKTHVCRFFFESHKHKRDTVVRNCNQIEVKLWSASINVFKAVLTRRRSFWGKYFEHNPASASFRYADNRILFAGDKMPIDRCRLVNCVESNLFIDVLRKACLEECLVEHSTSMRAVTIPLIKTTRPRLVYGVPHRRGRGRPALISFFAFQMDRQ